MGKEGIVTGDHTRLGGSFESQENFNLIGDNYKVRVAGSLWGQEEEVVGVMGRHSGT